jgi:hypothetical protein
VDDPHRQKASDDKNHNFESDHPHLDGGSDDDNSHFDSDVDRPDYLFE